jgi:predicted nucleic acid-binding protein
VSRIYWDTMLFIYWLEDNTQFAKRVKAIRLQMRERDDQLITGVFTLGEVLAGVHRKGTANRAQETRMALESAVSALVPFTAETAQRYGQIRGTLAVPSADAIHLACAASAATGLFLTSDKKLAGKIVPGIQFIATLDTNLF